MITEPEFGTNGSARGIDVDRSSNVLTLKNITPLEPAWASTADALVHWATVSPEAVFLAERRTDGEWHKMTYAQVECASRRLARCLIAIGCSPDKPLVVVAGNSVDHALLSLAAQRVGVAVAPVSLAYATVASDFARLRYMIELAGPAAIFFGEAQNCRAAIDAVSDIAPILVPGSASDESVRGIETISPADESAFSEAATLVKPDTIAKLMFTSGSTGKPKAVINTQRMLCTNQAMLRNVWPGLRKTPPVMVDWLPWSHTFGANFTFNLALFNGGALYIDAGKPVPALIDTTLRNLAEIRPTIYFNVPAGYEAILGTLRDDAALASQIFSRMEFAFCAAAALPQGVRNELQMIAARATGCPLPVYAGWGSTETAPGATVTWWDTDRSDSIGLPLPGIELRFVPDGNKLELRVRGPNVTPGYWKAPEASSAAFDENGFYRMGDAGRLIDEHAPELGVLFDGRISENFKLTSGSWVSVGAVRIGVVNEGRPIVQDVVVAGSGEAEIGLLVFVNHQACRELLGGVADQIDAAAIAHHPKIRASVASAIQSYNSEGRGFSSRIARFIIMPDVPRIEDYEITDKGYINQRAVLEARSESVEQLYANDVFKV